MAVNASILAIPNIGSQTTTIALCSMSLILGVHCIFAGIVAQHFGQKMKSLDYAVRVIYHAYCSVLIQTVTIVTALARQSY
jgi:Na+-driven multidrug efflux pump